MWEHDLVKTTLEIPSPLVRRARALAAKNGIKLQQLVTDALVDKIENAKRPSAAPAWKELSGGLRALRGETARILERIELDSE